MSLRDDLKAKFVTGYEINQTDYRNWLDEAVFNTDPASSIPQTSVGVSGDAHAIIQGNPHGLTIGDINAEPAKGTNDNYVTDVEKNNLHAPGSDDQNLTGLLHSNRSDLDQVSGTNTGDDAVNSSSATYAQGLLAATALQPGDQAAVGTVSTFYLDAATSFADNQFLSPAPSTYAQEVDSVAVASGTDGGIGFIERFVSGPLGVTSIPAGTWTFDNFCYSSNLTGNNKIITRINKRCEQTGMTGTFTGAGATRTFTVTGGAPFVAGDANASILLSSLIETPTQTAWISGFTSSSVVTVTLTDIAFVNVAGVTLNAIYYLIFNTESATPDITSTSVTDPHAQNFTVVQASPTSVDPTDRIVAAYFAYTDQVASRTINLLHGGSSFYSKIGTPLLGNLITQTITNGVTTTAPSENAVFDALEGKESLATVQDLGTKDTNFTVDFNLGRLATVTTGTGAATITIPDWSSATESVDAWLYATQGATARALTLGAASGTNNNIISSGGLMSAGDALPNSGASTVDAFCFTWTGTKWDTSDARFDIKA